ncbi:MULTISPECIES: DUF2247 family protein [Fusobacterium]|uniref:DUF2247 family protein n=1 Tax=Fusobacterium TaxID=848 RepID=UPI0030CBE283
MITLQDFKNNNLKINWKIIDIGCLGSKIFRNELSYDDIINFSLEKFDEKNKIILKIISSDKDEYEEIGILVRELANIEKSEYEIAFEKWELVYIKKNLPVLNKNFIQGLIELNDLWVKLDFPEDGPYILQGVNNNISPKEYYTEKNYRYLYNRHLNWIKDKSNYLNGK